MVVKGHLAVDGSTVAAGFGGHTVVKGAGSAGRFSGVEAVHMGKRNVRGSYPFHWYGGQSSPISNSMLEDAFIT